MTTSYIGTVLDALVVGLRNAMPPGVNVFSGKVPVDVAGLECVVVGAECELAEEPMAMGGERMETWDADCQMRIVAAWQGDVESTIKVARNRALTIFGKVETYVNDTYTGSLPDVEVIGPGTLANDFDTNGRVCWLTFQLQIRADKNP